jgi:hypothetical protein
MCRLKWKWLLFLKLKLKLKLLLTLTYIPLGTLPFVRGRKWIRNETCLSAASSFHFPFFDLHKREAEGQRLAVAFLCFLSLARQRKEVAAGLPPASHHGVATATSDKRHWIPA